MRKLITESNNHIFVSGATRSGKTYFVGRALAEITHPVLFINIQDEELPPRFMTVQYYEVDTPQLLDALRTGGKIDLRFGRLPVEIINIIIGHLLDKLMGAGYTEQRPVYVAMDECQILDGPGLAQAVNVATRGLHRGCRAVWITQRPALADKTLYTQSVEQYIFRLSPQEGAYFKGKGIDFDSCVELWQRNGQYSYVYTDGFILEGRAAVT